MTTHALYTVGSSTAVQLTPPGTHSGMDITLQSINETGYLYVGGSGVTASSYGYRLMPNHAISFELPGSDELYVIGENNNMKLAVIKTNLEVGE